MSEYQYYEFQAIDHPLDERAMAALRAITSRAEITPTSLVNVYHFGNFKGDPDRLMDQYFDAFLYEANWGTRRLMLRLPRRLFDLAVAKPYLIPYVLEVRATKQHVILHFHSEEEGGTTSEEAKAGWPGLSRYGRTSWLGISAVSTWVGWLGSSRATWTTTSWSHPSLPAYRTCPPP
jgi:hypothetical protein